MYPSDGLKFVSRIQNRLNEEDVSGFDDVEAFGAQIQRYQQRRHWTILEYMNKKGWNPHFKLRADFNVEPYKA